MDLAKIRKKSLQSQTGPIPDFIQPDATLLVKNELPVELFSGLTDARDSAHSDSTSPLVAVSASAAVSDLDNLPAMRSPLEVILYGRVASGCDSEAHLVEDDVSQEVIEDYHEFLIFRVSDEIYGVNIMDIKEIIKPREVTEVPRAPVFVTGILSLRGTIIPIIDMRTRLGLIREQITGKERVVVIKNAETFSGLLVDEVIQVVRVPNEAIEPAPAVLEGIDRDFVTGIGRSSDRLIILLNLANIADIQLY